MIDIIFFLSLLLSLGLTLAIMVPLTGALVRFRANYNPKGLTLDSEGGAQPYTGPVVSSFFAMLRRVYKLEGWAGLYKGLMPTLLTTSVVVIFAVYALGATNSHHGAYSAPDIGVFGTLVYSVFLMMVSLPSVIIRYRSITTPHRLPYFAPVQALRVLLTPTERRMPWILYLTPGLMATNVAHIAFVAVILGTLRRLILPRFTPDVPITEQFSMLRIGLFFILVALSTAVLTPLEVISARLAIQRNHADAGYNSVSQEVEGDAEEVAEYAGAGEDVIGLRSEGDPYLGLMDCAKRIVDEEGWRTLYRAWWLTMLGGLASAFS